MDFREVRRNKKQILKKKECESILKKSTSGVLCLLGDNDYPYGVPLSYAYDDGKLYFHGMPAGHKMDAMKKHKKASFTVIETDQVVPAEYTTYFRSVIVFGRMRILETPEEKVAGLLKLADKYSSDYKEGSMEEIQDKLKAVSVFVLDVEHLSGKEAIEFAEAR
ncbi:MAG TPA: pyridoxamine 5'-phosphate oxidase family protein [Candidatus Copromorpha excrementigallinarum]|uniref:Pyridoxamine 5'-phosphate oxidase family protein n=1 Tax=Candidatus Allocopromorpha excrementigallinarum TaxID=2840742 RepID=A0A9D1I356_9FIRM|nr:pyridoxamine 5'-phosphate oxidase family protein [Candidatus Copromorpha excrementigallinarum]